jgi:rRNA maturation protein Nop10
MHVNTNKTGSTISKEWTTPDCRNTPTTTNLEGEEIVDAPGKDVNTSMPEQVKRPNPWRRRRRKKKKKIMINTCEMLCVRITLI